jgi:demethylmenaquinone methyltransferase/2-methoxy-6-polyprenyl-1,4-benzoquinol methylase
VTGTELLAEQRRYYAARAPEYDDWWYRRGRYELEPEARSAWFADVAEVEAALDRFGVGGDVLELAAGTGLWTRRLVRTAARLVAVDASSEMLVLNRARVRPGGAEYVVADIFEWESRDRFDLCFFGFWLSHVPDERFAAFWSRVRDALRRTGRIFLVDSGVGDPAHSRTAGADELELRRLSDGREFRIVKRRWAPDELAGRLASLGWQLELTTSANGHFLYGGGR